MTLGLVNALSGQRSIPKIDRQVIINEKKPSWRIEKVIQYRYHEELNWYPKSVAFYHYDNDNFLEKTITYSGYSIETKKYAQRTEHRKSKDLTPITKITPYKDSNIKSWTKEKGTIWVKNTMENKVENYQFRFSPKSKEWYLYNLMTDSFENNQKIQRYFYSNIDPGNFPIQESKILFKYKDTLLIESLSMSKKGNDNNWILGRKENFEHQNGSIKKRELYLYSDNENEWKLQESEEFFSDKQTHTKIYFDYDPQNQTKTGHKIIEKRNTAEMLEERTQLNWDDKKKSFEHFFTQDFTNQGDLNIRVIESFSDIGNYYDYYETSNYYDSSNRLIKSEKKNKNEEDTDWKYLNGISFIYNQDDELPSMVQKTNAKGELSEESKIILDSLNNPIKRISIRNGRKRGMEIKHNYLIDADKIINSSELKLLETNIDKKIWRHNKAPIERIYFRIENGKKVKYRKIEYIFEEIN